MQKALSEIQFGNKPIQVTTFKPTNSLRKAYVRRDRKSERRMDLFGAIIFTCYSFLRKLDELKDDKEVYMRGVKYGVNTLLSKLDTNTLAKYIDAGYSADDEGFQNINTHFEILQDFIGALRFDEFGLHQTSLLSIAATMIREDEKLFQSKLGIQVGDSSDIGLMKKREHVKRKINKADAIQIESINAYLNNVLMLNSEDDGV